MKKLWACVLVLLFLAQPMTAWALTYSGSASYKTGKYYTALTAVQLTGDQRKDVVNIAKSQIGYQEGSSSSQLSGEVRGDGNYTEYGRWYGLQDMWCAMFVSWCAHNAGVPTSVVPSHSYTVSGLNKFISWGRAYTRAQVAAGVYTPQPGDVIYFKSSRNTNPTNHVGIVTSYSASTVYTVEGNTSSATISTNGGAVAAKSYSISNTYIVYICSPNYSNGTTPGGSTGGTTGVYFPACGYSYTSLADALYSIGVDGSLANRKVIAAANSIENYSGTPEQNTYMLDLLKAGKLVNPDGETPAPTPTGYFPACDSSYTTIAAALSSIGVDGSYANRKVIAAANSMEGYEGTPEQNTQMLELLKAGKLIDPDAKPSEPEPDDTHFKACESSYQSLATALESVGAESSYAYRKEIAVANGIADYSGTVDQNTQLLNLLKAGELLKPGTEVKPTVQYYTACDGSYTTIAAALSSIGVDSTYANRKLIAAANNMIGYEGKPEQNTQMLELLKAGTLIVPEEGLTLAPCGCKSTYTEHIAVAETCTENGAEYDRCTNCGKEANRVTTQAPGHSYNKTITRPTTTAEGAETFTCSCGESYAVSIPKRSPGDATGDSQITLKDAVIIRRYLAGGWNVTLNEYNADVDGDGTLTPADAVLIQRYMAGGWNVNLQ